MAADWISDSKFQIPDEMQGGRPILRRINFKLIKAGAQRQTNVWNLKSGIWNHEVYFGRAGGV